MSGENLPTTSELAQPSTEVPPKESMSETTSETKDAEMPDVQTQLDAAKKLIRDDAWEPAVDMFSTLLESLTKDAQIKHPQMAEIYYRYGEALFRLSQSQNDVFGAPIREKQAEFAALQAIDEEEQEDTEMAEAENETTQQQENCEGKETPSDEQQPQQEETASNTQENGDQKEQTEEEDPNSVLANAFASIFEQAHAMKAEMDAAAANGDVDTSDDRVLAWESLETARMLLSDSSVAEDRKMLAEIHHLLAELQMEDEAFDAAAGDFAAAVRIHSELNAQPRVIAAVYFMWAISSTYSENNALAKEQFEKSAELLLNQLARISGQNVDEGGRKSEAVGLLADKDGVLKRATAFGELKGGGVRDEIRTLIIVFQDTLERVEESGRADTEKQEVERVLNDENGDEGMNGVTTIGFEPAAPTSAPVNDLGIIRKKKKRTAEDAGLSEAQPAAKKQRIEE